MSSTEQLDKMLIEHLADLDDGARRLDILQDKIAEAIDDLVKEWTTAKGWKTGDETWKDDWGATVALPRWYTEEENWLAWFALDFASGDDGESGEEKDYFWLTRLCGEGRGKMGFRFVQTEFGRAPWKKFLKEIADRFADTQFILDDVPSFFLPLKVDKDLLAKGAAEEDFTEALQPITEALDYICKVSPRFEQIRREMQERQGS
ncbi:hypothetical protein IMCC20628_03995 [Hoeflea sp. IMCC20628]|uniref:hypothetical protein n=1 Tax=Hoeflea sp. IMCC20628 TaxID=1620421 RepID=UPI00063B05DB|nr:hypothetical protein [Hoeflea sp. IMCC20628]AKI02675.1 hypothetical protein IMCC20628_03995 [Hoeflea sp. IMCC20628]